MAFHRTSEGVDIYYERDGSGDEPVVLIHGTGVDHVWWDLQAAPLLDDGRYTVIRLNMRGAGRSTVLKDMSRYSMEMMAHDVIGVLDQERIDRAHFIGHSLGSCVAQEIALQFPDRVRSLQLHATWARADTWMKRAWIGTSEYSLRLGDVQQTFKTITMWAFSPEYLETWGPEHVAVQFRRTLLENPYLQANEGMLGHLAADKAHDTVARLPQIKAPTLVTAGEADYLIPPRYSEQVARLITGSRYHLFTGPRSSHAYSWEMVDEFNRMMFDFLASPSRGARA